MSRRARRTKPGPLALFLMDRVDETWRAAVKSGGGVEEIAEAIDRVLSAPDVLLRYRSAGGHERMNLQDLLPTIKEMAELHVLPPTEPWEPGGPGAEHLPGFEAVAREYPALAAPDVETRLRAGPEAIGRALTVASETLISTADKALREVAGDAEPPTQQELGAWLGKSECPPDALAEAERRLAALVKKGPGHGAGDSVGSRRVGWGV